MPSRIPLWHWIQGKGVLLVKSLHAAVVFSGCGDSLRTGRRVLSCPARECSRSMLSAPRVTEEGGMGRSLECRDTSDRSRGYWYHIRDQVRWPARQMERIRQNSPLAVTLGLIPGLAFHFWLY